MLQVIIPRNELLLNTMGTQVPVGYSGTHWVPRYLIDTQEHIGYQVGVEVPDGYPLGIQLVIGYLGTHWVAAGCTGSSLGTEVPI